MSDSPNITEERIHALESRIADLERKSLFTDDRILRDLKEVSFSKQNQDYEEEKSTALVITDSDGILFPTRIINDAAFQIEPTDFIINAVDNASGSTVTLPEGVPGKTLIIHSYAGTINIYPSGTDTIDGGSPYAVLTTDSVILSFLSGTWFPIFKYIS